MRSYIHVLCTLLYSWWRTSGDSEKSSAQSHTSTHSSSARIGLSKDGWRVRIRQAWLTGLLERSMRVGKGHNLMGKIIFNTFQLSAKGHSYFQSPHSVTLPPASALTHSSAAKQTSGGYTHWSSVFKLAESYWIAYMYVHMTLRALFKVIFHLIQVLRVYLRIVQEEEKRWWQLFAASCVTQKTGSRSQMSLIINFLVFWRHLTQNDSDTVQTYPPCHSMTATTHTSSLPTYNSARVKLATLRECPWQ